MEEENVQALTSCLFVILVGRGHMEFRGQVCEVGSFLPPFYMGSRDRIPVSLLPQVLCRLAGQSVFFVN